MSVLGDRLREARERKNLKQIQVMAKTGINNSTLSGYEKGVSEPDVQTLVKLSELYEVSIDWLYGRINERKKVLSNEAREFLNAINLENDEEAIKKLNDILVYKGKKLPEAAVKEILSFARYKASESKS